MLAIFTQQTVLFSKINKPQISNFTMLCWHDSNVLLEPTTQTKEASLLKPWLNVFIEILSE